MENKRIIAVVGMAGSGKTEVIEYLQKKHGWPKVYLGDSTFERMEKDGLELNYENERLTREKIRAEMGMGAYALLALPKIRQALEKSDTVLIESHYSWDEYKIFKNEFSDTFEVLAVYASPKVRFERLKTRKIRPINDIDTFRTRDWSEIEGTDKGGPIAVADYTIVNHETREVLHGNIDKIL